MSTTGSYSPLSAQAASVGSHRSDKRRKGADRIGWRIAIDASWEALFCLLIEIGYDVRDVLVTPQAGEAHLVAGDEFLRVLEIFRKRLIAPDDAGLGHRVRKSIAFGGTGRPADDAVEARADQVPPLLETVANPALVEYPLALRGVARGSRIAGSDRCGERAHRRNEFHDLHPDPPPNIPRARNREVARRDLAL